MFCCKIYSVVYDYELLSTTTAVCICRSYKITHLNRQHTPHRAPFCMKPKYLVSDDYAESAVNFKRFLNSPLTGLKFVKCCFIYMICPPPDLFRSKMHGKRKHSQSNSSCRQKTELWNFKQNKNMFEVVQFLNMLFVKMIDKYQFTY